MALPLRRGRAPQEAGAAGEHDPHAPRTFDALERFRTRALASGGTDTYWYAGTSETVLRINNSVSGVTDSLVDPAGNRHGVSVGGTVNWFLPDLHGSVAGALNASESTLVNAIRYDAWGEVITTGSAGAGKVADDKWRYQGRLDVSPTGLSTPLYDMSARFYAPGLGAFTQLDSAMGSALDPLSMDRFLYAEANPATLIDPDGHRAIYNDGDACNSCDPDGEYGAQPPISGTSGSKTKSDPNPAVHDTPTPSAEPQPVFATPADIDALPPDALKAYVAATIEAVRPTS